MDSIVDIYDLLATVPQNVLLGSLALILTCYLYLRYRFTRQPLEIIAYEGGNGTVTVARYAITELIRKAATSTEGVAKCHTRMRVRRGLLHLRLKLHLRANYKLKDVSTSLNAKITEALRVTLGIERLGNIDVMITHLVGSPDMRHAVNESLIDPSGVDAETVFSSSVDEGDKEEEKPSNS